MLEERGSRSLRRMSAPVEPAVGQLPVGAGAGGDAVEALVAAKRRAGKGRNFCTECGAELEGAGKFCVECGYRMA